MMRLSVSCVFQQCRTKFKWPNGVKYDGFTYYPRFPDQQDPVYEPTKLLRVERVKPFSCRLRLEKDILSELGIHEKNKCRFTVVKNIPEVVAKLWHIKHLVKISPVTFPNGFPTEHDLNGSYLDENGRFFKARSYMVSDDRQTASDRFEHTIKKSERLDGHILRKDSRKKWNEQ